MTSDSVPGDAGAALGPVLLLPIGGRPANDGGTVRSPAGPPPAGASTDGSSGAGWSWDAERGIALLRSRGAEQVAAPGTAALPRNGGGVGHARGPLLGLMRAVRPGPARPHGRGRQETTARAEDCSRIGSTPAQRGAGPGSGLDEADLPALVHALGLRIQTLETMVAALVRTHPEHR